MSGLPKLQSSQKGQALSDDSADDLDYVQQVYHYVIENITYDKQKAETVASGYIPDPDATMESGTGICFDYASLMTALLRSSISPQNWKWDIREKPITPGSVYICTRSLGG